MTEKELFAYIKKLIDAGTTGTTELSGEIGKDVRTARRYLIKMSNEGMITLDENSGRIAKTTMQQEADKLERINLDDFADNEVISKWLGDCEARGITARTIGNYFSAIKNIFAICPINPKYVVSSKNNALEFWRNFMKEYKLKTGKAKPTSLYRVAFKNLLDSYNIAFAHKMGKQHGLGSEHDSYKKYAGVCLKKDQIEKVSQAMLQAKDYSVYLWFRLGLRTGARSSAIASMTWERIYFDQESFKLEQHESKDKQGHHHLGIDGDWKTKFPNEEIKNLLLEWKVAHPEFRRFVWFEDAGQDVSNKIRAKKIHEAMAQKMKIYYKVIENELDPTTLAYLKNKPDHLMRHTFAQILKDNGFTDEEIAEAGGWRGTQTISWYSSMPEHKKQELGGKISRMNF